MATLCVEKCIALGAKRIIVYSWCGAVSQQVNIGDLVLPISGVSEEGTSRHYEGEAHIFEPDMALMTSLDTMLQCNEYHTLKGCVWTTDAVYRETREKVAQYGAAGVLGVDMEYTALASVAAFRGVQLAALMLVSDELYHETWQSQLHTHAFRSTSKHILALLCQAAAAGNF